MKELRDYQVDISERAVNILRSRMIVYLAMEVRTGKTITALNIAKLYNAKKVLFITKIKAFGSIKKDQEDFGFTFDLTIINKESIHKIKTNDFDVVVCDEAHGLFGTFPKPNKFTKEFKVRFSHLPLILLSGTPTPESYSQIFHQFWVSKFSPFGEPSFYKWAKIYIEIYQKNLGYGLVNFYDKANEKLVKDVVDKYMIRFSQKESGFTSSVDEQILYCTMSDVTYSLANRLKKDLVIQGKEELIMADTAVKLMSKLHQLYSGTVKFESGNTKILDPSKAIFIHDKFKGVKIGIFYKFKAEYELLKSIYGDELTNDLEEFDNSNKSIALQFVSGREGISLKNAKYLVAINIDFSATTYFQFKDRMTTKDRVSNTLYWVFTKGGMEDRIYKAVSNKKSYTSNYFKKQYGIKFPEKSNS